VTISTTSAALAVPKVTYQEHLALQALARGEADAGQQWLALEVIVKKFAQPQELLYIPGSFDETAFANGRAFVAGRIRYYLHKSAGDTQKQENQQ
jgi:hypothetical protein